MRDPSLCNTTPPSHVRRIRWTAFIAGLVLGAVSITAPANQQSGYPEVVDPNAVPLNEDDTTPLAQTAHSDLAVADTSAGCGRSVSRTGEFNLTAKDGTGKTRTYNVYLPATYDRSRAYPLVFVFHGASGTASQAYSWGLQNAPGAGENAIFIFPQGISFKNYGVGWDDTKGGYDLPFFDNMVKASEAAYCVNAQRIFAAGFSWGGDFVTALVCARGSTVRAAEVNSATDEFNNKNDSHTYQNSPCPSPTHPAIRFQHAANGDGAYPAPLFATTSSLFQRFNKCNSGKTEIKASFSGMVCYSYNSCGSKALIECAFPSSMGHSLPTNWAKDTWAYFSTFT